MVDSDKHSEQGYLHSDMKDDELLYKNCTLEKLRDASFWKALCPFMSCDEAMSDVKGCIAGRLGVEASDQLKERGYFQIRPTQFDLEARR
jgi:hypothetical protein